MQSQKINALFLASSVILSSCSQTWQLSIAHQYFQSILSETIKYAYQELILAPIFDAYIKKSDIEEQKKKAELIREISKITTQSVIRSIAAVNGYGDDSFNFTCSSNEGESECLLRFMKTANHQTKEQLNGLSKAFKICRNEVLSSNHGVENYVLLVDKIEECMTNYGFSDQIRSIHKIILET